MPLLKGSSQETIARNIAELHHANKEKPKDEKRSNKQILAIAYSMAHKGGK